MFSVIIWSRLDVVAAREGCDSGAKEWRAESAAFWLGSLRRLESIAEGGIASVGGEGSRIVSSDGGRSKVCHVWLSFCNLQGQSISDTTDRVCLHAHLAICSSSSRIFARFAKFLGLDFGATDGGVNSLLSNQSDKLDLVEKSFSSCD